MISEKRTNFWTIASYNVILSDKMLFGGWAELLRIDKKSSAREER